MPISRDVLDVARQAFVSRVVVLTAILISDWAIPDYDTSSTGVNLAGSCQVNGGRGVTHRAAFRFIILGTMLSMISSNYDIPCWQTLRER